MVDNREQMCQNDDELKKERRGCELGDELYNLTEMIVRYRAKYDLNQEEFAKRCGLTKQTIGSIESGRHGITKLTRAKIMQVLEEE